MKRLPAICLLCLSLLFVACTPVTTATKLPPTATPLPPSTPPATALPEPTPTSPSTTATALTIWQFYDLSDPTLPSLLHEGDEGYYLDPAWSLLSIEYVDQWWGLGEPGLDVQRIDRLADTFDFVNGDGPVDRADVQALLDAMTHLYPTDSLLGGNAWTDDYPSWLIELTGTDGQRVLLFASSTGNVGYGPWVFLINGQLYAQYSGAVAEPLGQLFETRLGNDEDVFEVPEDVIHFGTRGWPNQLQGFYGLTPIADSFRYGPNWDEGTMSGTIQGRSSIGGFGHMVIGTIDRLNRVELQRLGEVAVPCTIEDVADVANDPSAAAWRFTCPVTDLTPGTAYRYDILVEFGTTEGDSAITTGQLWGVWHDEDSQLRLHAPSQLEAAILAHETARTVWQTHTSLGFNYAAQINPQNPNEGTWAGEVILAGETTIQGQTLRYTIGTPFGVTDGVLTTWSLTPQAIADMVAEIGLSPLLTQALTIAPDLVLNLWYAENAALPEIESWIDEGAREYETNISACGEFPAYVGPSANQPLRAFSLNRYGNFWSPEFVLTSEGIRVANMDLFPYRSDEGGLLPLLQPDLFDTGEIPPFERIWWQGKSFFGSQAELTLWIPEGADAAALETYNGIANALPVPINQEYETLWTATGVGFYLTAEGLVELMACR